MDTSELKRIIECLIFIAHTPVTLDELKKLFDGVNKQELESITEEVVAEFNTLNKGFYIAKVSGGYQFRTRDEFAPWIRNYLKARPQKLTKPALETLAIIAYKQPVSRAEIESIRGVDTGGVLKTLLERRLIRIMGRLEMPGRPLVYGTTREFLELFGLNDIKSLPTLKDYEDLARELKENREPESGDIEFQSVEPGAQDNANLEEKEDENEKTGEE
jgi:segregation and condensation protein B